MDITRFHAAFFEESREGLDAMEGGLLSLESGGGDAETINVIFRAAHSIKGGAATFGFSSVTDLTHLLETLLDEARAGRRTLDPVARSEERRAGTECRSRETQEPRDKERRDE